MSTSSRESKAGAGWGCAPGRYQKLMDDHGVGRRPPFSWLSPVPLWQSRNDRVARLFGDPVNAMRVRWMSLLGSPTDLVVDRSAESPISFLVIGDTGEGDASQWAAVPPLQAVAGDTAFMFVCSDVIYPAGGVNAYRDRFFDPYDWYANPIYAVPGNHDWYDDGEGFMRWFCGTRERLPVRVGSRRHRLLRMLGIWRRAPRVDEKLATAQAARHDQPGMRASQPAPYFAIDAGPVRLVGIDTGITGTIDEPQRRWLERVSEGERPKILLTGKPLRVDGEPRDAEVDAIVRKPAHHYIAAIGGDIHNYQRYLEPDRRLLYLVSGGGGAFMHETHSIGNIGRTGLGVAEEDFRCYPLRGDSLSRYSVLYGRKVRWLGLRRFVEIDANVAAKIIGGLIGVEPTRPEARNARVTLRARIAARILLWLPGRGRRGLHLPFSEWLDFNEPPMFKSFLRVDVREGEVRIRCFAATGCQAQEDAPPVEDHLLATEDPAGQWTWAVV
jgi:calcineurin-like phosphoesterase family protein